MLLHDPYALHRKWWDWEWKPEIGDDAWTDWDYILAEVYQLIQDYTDRNTGQLLWYDQSGDVYWDVQSSFSGSAAAVELKQKNYTLKPGESLYAVPVFGEVKPTLASWAKDMEEQKADLRPAFARDARPPTSAELKALREKNSNSGKLE